LIGYFVLGPSDLYKLVKEIGKFIQNFQNFAAEATESLENNMESQLQLEEIRKTQQELTDAFSFRRSINVEADSDPFEVNVQTPRGQDDVMTPPINEPEYDMSTSAAAGAAVAPKKKKMRRVKRKKKVAVEPTVTSEIPEESIETSKNNVAFGTNVSSEQLANDIPSELDIDDEMLEAENKAMERILNGSNDDLKGEEESSKLAAEIREERIERLERAQSQVSESDDDTSSLVEQSRFQQQMSGDWNQQVIANTDKLEPLAEVMNLLAVLEEEKIAADKRLQEEFKAREVNEEKFYLEKRKILEEAAAGVQTEAYAGNIPTATPSTVNDS
jgi:Sec-independent protein translocase protein TatA